ncbi:MAG: PilC/PilY family type IV pilus protein [Nitrospirota bacterium]
MNDYCLTPPYVVAGVQPNLLLMIDNSASMLDLAYLSGSKAYCYDNSYDNSKDYAGYFSRIDQTTLAVTYPIYIYVESRGLFQFKEVPSMPGSCTYGGSSSIAPYVCINVTGGEGQRVIDKFVASGRFLNWLASSKFDVQKQALTGGKYDPEQKILTGESRGCAGRRFIRETTALSGVTFAVRGPHAWEPDYAGPETQAGLTRIEIYEGSYDEKSCLSAIEAWQTGNQGNWESNTRKCFDPSADNQMSDESSVFIEGAKACFRIKENSEMGASGEGLFSGVSLHELKEACAGIYANCPGDIDVCRALNDETRGSYICSGDVAHVDPFPPYDSLRIDRRGFLGTCWQENAGRWPPGDDCVKNELLHFCSGYANAEVIDPSQGAADTPATGNIPAIVMDAGARTLGNPLAPAGSGDKFFYAKVSTISYQGMNQEPKGLIQEFGGKQLVRLGAMSFNSIGSDSENLPADSTVKNLDGGRLLENGYIGDPIGDHHSGLIAEIDALKAASWTPLSEAFYNAIGYFSQNRGMRINPGDFKTAPEKNNPVQYPCQKNYIHIISDGMSTADQEANVRNFVRGKIQPAEKDSGSNDDSLVTTAASPSFAALPKFFGSLNLDDLAWYAHNFSIFDPAYSRFSTDPKFRIQNAKDVISTYVTYTGDPCPHKNAEGFCDSVTETDAERLMQETALHGGGLSAYQRVEDFAKLYGDLRQSFLEITHKASSGTSASVLSSGEGSGANLLQALFFPERTIGGTTLAWTGSVYSFWYYIDPLLGMSGIREDTKSPLTLNLKDDYIMKFGYPASATDDNAVANLYWDSDGDGDIDHDRGIKYLDEYLNAPADGIKYLWEAGKQLWKKDPLSRNIYTFDGTNRRTIANIPNPITESDPLKSFLGSNVGEANAIVRYTRGEDTPFVPPVSPGYNPNFRDRKITIDGISQTWKLGDIIASTPKMAAWIPLNTYHKVYFDESYGPIGHDPKPADPPDPKHFISRAGYKRRGTVFTGANDGMLHAFNLGAVRLYEEKFRKADISGTGLGEEMWAYIPKHSLPYLKHLTDPDYCHMYFVDAVPYLFDVSIGGHPAGAISPVSWRTILIGGMRLGGACKNDDTSHGVKTPLPGIGYSSYFALDVTDTLSDASAPPEILWEFSDEDIARLFGASELDTGGLGFTTSGPAILRIGQKGKNGKWFVVFGSGPTGPIDGATHQFLGHSDQKLKLFIIELRQKHGAGRIESGEIWRLDTGLLNAFAGSLAGGPVDVDQNNPGSRGFYSDDALYFGYTQAEVEPATSNWTKGGVLRLVTHESDNPAAWDLSAVIEDIGPVTAAVSKLQNYTPGKEALWLFFGDGRYYYKRAADVDDAGGKRKLYGLREPCFETEDGDAELRPGCGAHFTDGRLGDVTFSSANAEHDGWKIRLDPCTDGEGAPVLSCGDSDVYRSERVITDPLATTIGAVFFATVKPSAGVCDCGGSTHLWAVKYDTGGALKKGVLRGKALIQVSTGSVIEKDLATAFTQKKDEGAPEGETVEYRRTDAEAGVTTQDKPRIIVPPKPMRRILHIREQ